MTQIEFLQKHGIDYTVENGKITINGWLDLSSLQTLDPQAMAGTTINGDLYLSSLQTLDPQALAGTTINGDLYLSSLSYEDQKYHRSVIQRLQDGYNETLGYCFFDGILSKVLKVSEHKGYTVYETPFEFVVQKEKFTSHGKTIKKAISDLEFKIVAEKLKNEPIYPDTEITVRHYRLITGACENGVKQWLKNNKIDFTEKDGILETKPIKAKDLIPMLEETNAYGLEKFKSLMKDNQ